MHGELSPCLSNADRDDGSEERSHHGTISEPEIFRLLVDVRLHVPQIEVLHDLVPVSFATNCARGSTIHDCPANCLRDKVDALMDLVVDGDLVHLVDIGIFNHRDLVRDLLDAVGWKSIALESWAMLSCTSTCCGFRSCRR